MKTYFPSQSFPLPRFLYVTGLFRRISRAPLSNSIQLRGRSHMTSAEIWDFWTPCPLSLSHSRTYQYYPLLLSQPLPPSVRTSYVSGPFSDSACSSHLTMGGGEGGCQNALQPRKYGHPKVQNDFFQKFLHFPPGIAPDKSQ